MSSLILLLLSYTIMYNWKPYVIYNIKFNIFENDGNTILHKYDYLMLCSSCTTIDIPDTQLYYIKEFDPDNYTLDPIEIL